jgi:hypothetical protein
MPLPSGPQPWRINANGSMGDLFVTSVSADGKVSGTVFGDQIDGFWDEDAQRITFIRVPPQGSGVSAVQVYTGFKFENTSGSDTTHTLCGFFEAFAGAGGSAQRNLFGWFASIRIIG